MKNIYLRCVLLIISLSFSSLSNSQEPYFCVEKGAKLEYTQRATNGKVEEYVQMEVLDVQNLDTLTTISYNSTVLNGKRQPKSDVAMNLVANISSDTLSINLVESIALLMEDIAGKDVDEDIFKMSGDAILLPSNMKVGDQLPDSYISIEVMFLNINISVTDRVALREEVLITDLGVYPCMVIKERTVCSGMVGFNKNAITLTWYSRGVGMVKQEKYNKKGKLESISLLTSKTI